MDNSDLSTAINYTTPCKDKNGFGACDLYKVTVKNTSNIPVTVESDIQLIHDEEDTSFENLVWQEISSLNTVGTITGATNGSSATLFVYDGVDKLDFTAYFDNGDKKDMTGFLWITDDGLYELNIDDSTYEMTLLYEDKELECEIGTDKVFCKDENGAIKYSISYSSKFQLYDENNNLLGETMIEKSRYALRFYDENGDMYTKYTDYDTYNIYFININKEKYVLNTDPYTFKDVLTNDYYYINPDDSSEILNLDGDVIYTIDNNNVIDINGNTVGYYDGVSGNDIYNNNDEIMLKRYVVYFLENENNEIKYILDVGGTHGLPDDSKFINLNGDEMEKPKVKLHYAAKKWRTGDTLEAGAARTYYLAVWVSNVESNQATTDYGNYGANITFRTLDSGIKGDFSTNSTNSTN